MNPSDPSKAHLNAQLRALVAGTQKHTPNQSIKIGGVTYTEAEVVQMLQDLAGAVAQVDATRAAWKDALKAMRDAKAKVGPFIKAYRSWILATNGDAPAVLGDYGIELKARTPPDAVTVAEAVDKRAATRKARGTLGPKARLAIKGEPNP
jgi:hypothetical protein